MNAIEHYKCTSRKNSCRVDGNIDQTDINIAILLTSRFNRAETYN